MRPTFYRKHEGLILGGVAVLLALAGWQALWSSGRISPLFFSGAVGGRWCGSATSWTQGRLKDDLLYSGLNFAIGVGLAIAAGVVLGVIIGWYRKLAMVFEPFLNALYATPRVAHGAADSSSGSASACGPRCSSCSSTPCSPC